MASGGFGQKLRHPDSGRGGRKAEPLARRLLVKEAVGKAGKSFLAGRLDEQPFVFSQPGEEPVMDGSG